MSAQPNYSAAEREALAALFADFGPGEPTLCTGWQTRDLLVHLVLRESGNLTRRRSRGTRPVKLGF